MVHGPLGDPGKRSKQKPLDGENQAQRHEEIEHPGQPSFRERRTGGAPSYLYFCGAAAGPSAPASGGLPIEFWKYRKNSESGRRTIRVSLLRRPAS